MKISFLKPDITKIHIFFSKLSITKGIKVVASSHLSPNLGYFPSFVHIKNASERVDIDATPLEKKHVHYTVCFMEMAFLKPEIT